MAFPLWDAQNSNRKTLRIFDARHGALHDASIMAYLTREAPLDAVIVQTPLSIDVDSPLTAFFLMSPQFYLCL